MGTRIRISIIRDKKNKKQNDNQNPITTVHFSIFQALLKIDGIVWLVKMH